MSIMRPVWPHSAIEVLTQINNALIKRLNSDAQPSGLWRCENGQLNLSKPGQLRIIWSILGGPITRGVQYHGPDQPARCVAARQCRLQAEIRTNKPDTQGITDDDIKLAEEVLRALVIVWNQQRPADFDEDLQEEQWDGFSENPGQREIVVRYLVTPLLLVHADPYQFKQIETVESVAIPVVP